MNRRLTDQKSATQKTRTKRAVYRVLSVGRDTRWGTKLAAQLEESLDNVSVSTTHSTSVALDRFLQSEQIDVLVSSDELADSDALDFVAAVRETHPDLPVVLCAKHGDETFASEAIRRGVTDYVPCGNGLEAVATRIQEAIESVESSVPDSRQNFRELVDVTENASDALWLFSRDWEELLYVNSACEQFWGCSIREFTTEPEKFTERVHPADRESVDLWMDALSEGQTETLEYRIRGKNGEERWVRSHGTPITNSEGTVKRIAGFTRDVTEQKAHRQRVKQERYTLRRIEDIADVGSWTLTPSDTVILTSGASRIYGRPDWTNPALEEMLEAYQPNGRERIREAIAACRETGDPVDLELRMTGTDGTRRWVAIKAERGIQDGQQMLYGTIQDVTEQKEREQRLMVLTRALRHNLRNKLTVVFMATEQIERTLHELRADDGVDIESATNDTVDFETVIEETKRIFHAAENLSSLGEKVRELERAIQLTDQQTTVNVAPIVRNLAESYRQQYPNATIETSLEDVFVQGRKRPIQVALEELLENAMMHCGENPTVVIDIDQPSDREVCVHIADDGPGIPAMERDVIETSDESPLVHGSSIGLWTVNLLMMRCGGQVSIEDNDPHGTVVTLTLPAGTALTTDE